MYTEQKGFQTFIIHSVRKPRATTPSSYLQLLSLVDMVAYHHDQKKINHIKEIRLDYSYQSIPFDMRKSSVIMCIAEITSKCIPTSYAQPELFNFLHESLIKYDDPENMDRDFMIRYLVNLSHYLGFGMELPAQIQAGQYFDLMEGNIQLAKPFHRYFVDAIDLQALKTIIHTPPGKNADIPIETRQRLIDLLVVYYQLHVESLKQVNSLRILRELL